MAIIEVKRIIEEKIQIPNCFCGNEPEVVYRRAQGDDCKKQIMRIECPYCGAHSPVSKQFDLHSINSQYDATREVINAWCYLLRGGRNNERKSY